MGSLCQRWCAALLHIRILLVILAERGWPFGRDLQLGQCYVHCNGCDLRCRLSHQGSPCIQGTRGVLGSMEGEIEQVPIIDFDSLYITFKQDHFTQTVEF